MGKPATDITGERFGRLTVTGRIGDKHRNALWAYLCDCGTEHEATGGNLRCGRTNSCGCLHAELLGERVRKHGFVKTPTYMAWQGAKDRCYNPKNVGYHNYGGRGIRMCNEWRNDFLAFLAHVGIRPRRNLSLDRIDVDGHYEPGNVRWATRTTQARNTRWRKHHQEPIGSSQKRA